MESAPTNWANMARSCLRQAVIDKLFPTGYSKDMGYEIKRTKIFDKWLARLKDAKNVSRIKARLNRVTVGNLGDHKQLTAELFELRFTFGGGLRIYYTRRGNTVIFLLAGGNKSTQSEDIAKATAILRNLEE